jgi:hypothetical protein
MSEQLEREVAEIGVRLLDAAHIGWLAAESECEQALNAWLAGAAGKPAAAYCRYRAALDREAAAAGDLHRLWELTQPCRESLCRRQEGVVT